MALSMVIALFWGQLTIVKSFVNFLFNPTAGALLTWNLAIGMFILVAILTLFSTLVQKYATDQKELRRLKKEQKDLQKKMKEFKEHPEKLAELQKELLPLTGKMMKVSMGGMIYTYIPFILFFRWFNDFFVSIGNPSILFGLSWFWFYFILTMIISTGLRKLLKIA